MKDYSKFIQSSYGFIIKYEISGDEILVYTAESDLKEPHRYTLDADNLEAIDKRMKKQYELLLENREIVKEDFLTHKNKVTDITHSVITGVLCGIGMAFSLAFLSPFPGIISIFLSLTSWGISRIVVKNKGIKLDQELDTYQAYIDNMNDMALVSQKDKNLIEYMSKSARKKYDNNESLVRKHYTESIFNIDFMDKVELEDLKKLLNRYMISKGLCSDQEFVVPDTKGKGKTRKRVQNNKNN